MEDNWHTSGSSVYHSRPENEKLIIALKTTFPKKELNIVIGNTGYPSGDYSGYFNEPCWVEDELKRFYFFTGDERQPIIFQRYTQGQVFMVYERINSNCYGWTTISQDKSTELINRCINLHS